MNERGTLDGKTVRFERLLPGPIERVWSYLTEGALLTTWLAVDGAVPPRVGATFVLRMGGGDDMPEREGHSVETYCTVLEYEPPRALAYTWGVHAPDGTMLDSTVRFALEQRGERVSLVLTHGPVMEGFESRTLAGWHQLLDAFGARLSGREPQPFMETFRAIEAEYSADRTGASPRAK